MKIFDNRRRIFYLFVLVCICRKKITRIRKDATTRRLFAIYGLQQTLNNSLYCKQFLRMSPDTFHKLLNKVKPFMTESFISEGVRLAITLHFLGNNEPIISQCRIFALSNGSIQKVKYETINSLFEALKSSFNLNSALWRKSMLRATSNYPEFDGGFAAVDGTHVPIRTLAKNCDLFRNRKSFVSTNLLILCNLKQRMLFVGTGAPGSYHDSSVYKKSPLFTMLQTIPANLFVFADAGYGISKRLLTPYRGTRYHLKEYAAGTSRPQNPKELFNMRHSKTRNVVERTIGILKRRWRLMRYCNESLDFEFISQCFMVCGLIHNLLMDENDLILDEEFEDIDMLEAFNEENSSQIEWTFEQSKGWRDTIAMTMWTRFI